MLFLQNITADTLPEMLVPYQALLSAPETDTESDPSALAAFIEMARTDIAAQRKNEEAPPTVSASVFAAVMQNAVRGSAPRHLLSDGLSVMLYHANHNARGGLFGLVGTEIASKIGYVPPEYENSRAWTEAVAAVTAAIAALSEALGYDTDFTENYIRRTARTAQ